jgi:hypothetical protein
VRGKDQGQRLEAKDIRERNKEIMECWNIGRMEK